MSVLHQAMQMANGASILSEWLGHGSSVVDNETAQARADICLVCPKHTQTYSFTEAIGDAIRRQLELKKHLQLRVQGEKQLHVCSVCGCAMRLKIWIPIDNIRPTAEEAQQFHPNCWLLK